MKKLTTILVLILVALSSTTAQRYYDDRYFYDEQFDWHWDIRVRISEGINSGFLSNWEAKRLYRRLERIEEKEYRFMADGRYTSWEQNIVWDDVVWLNRQVGIRLYDVDMPFYGFGHIYIGFNTYPFWYNRYYVNGWNFNRFDRLGWGSVRYGYTPRYYYPRHNVYVRKKYNRSRSRYNSRFNDNVVRRSASTNSRGVGIRRNSRSTNGRTSAYGGRARRAENSAGSSVSRTRSRTERPSYGSSPSSRSSSPSVRQSSRSSSPSSRSSSPSVRQSSRSSNSSSSSGSRRSATTSRESRGPR